MNWHSRLEHAVFKTILLEDSFDKLADAGISVRANISKTEMAEVRFADFSPVIRQRAIQMQHVYVSFFCLENAVRELISQRLVERHDANWWVNKVPQKIQEAVKTLKEKETGNRYHAQRSDSEIGYTTLGHLQQIIIANWEDFVDLFPNQAWVTSRFGDLEMSRNILMHTNVLPPIEVDRIDSIVRDWLRQVG